ncbi:MAG: T9SS type A sorting domain-containing protein [Flavobacteriales bacterium]|jgi:hypothetical protein
MKTNNGGNSWTPIPGQPAAVFTPGDITNPHEWVHWDRNVDNLTIETTPSEPNGLFVLYDLPSDGIDELYRITGIPVYNWQLLASNLFVLHGAGNGFGVSRTAIPDVAVANNDRYRTYIANAWHDYNTLTANYLQYHVDVEDLVWHPSHPGELWMADHGGVHKSIDNGVTWEWRGKGLGVAEVFHMATSYSEPDRVLLGLYHDASLLTEGEHSTFWDPDWKQLGGNDGQQCMIDPIEGNRVYWSSQWNNWKRSTNYGDNPQAFSSTSSNDWDTDGAMDRIQPNYVYIPNWVNGTNASEEITRSMDYGATFETISDFQTLLAPSKGNVWRLYPAWSDPQYLYAFFYSESKFTRTKIARGTASIVKNSWKLLAHPDPTREIKDVEFDFENPNVTFIIYSTRSLDDPTPIGSGMVFKADYTDEVHPVFTDLTGSPNTWTPLPNVGVGAFAIERGTDGGMYVSTDVGVFYTNNKLMASGDGWQLFGTNLPHVECKELQINYKANVIRAGLNGRGLWEHNLWCPDVDDTLQAGTYSANSFLEVMNDINSTAIVPPSYSVIYRAGNEVKLQPGFHAQSGTNFHAVIHPCNSGGNSFKSTAAGYSDLDWNSPLKASETLWVQPNPSSGTFSVILQQGYAPIVHLELFNAQGVKVPMILSSTDSPITISLGTANSAGVYTLRVYSEDGTIGLAKIIIQP